MRKYIINWSCNNSTYGSFESNSIRESIKSANEILRGETFIGNNFYYDIAEAKSQMIVHSNHGYKNNNGKLIYR